MPNNLKHKLLIRAHVYVNTNPFKVIKLNKLFDNVPNTRVQKDSKR